MSESTGKQQHGIANVNMDQSLVISIEIGLSTLDKLQVPIDNTTTVRDLKCKIEVLSGIPSDLFELNHDGTVLTGRVFPLMSELEGLGRMEVKLKMQILPVWERFISTCLKAENSQVRARIRVKMHGVTKDERIFAACFVAARQANSCLLFGILPSNKMISRTVQLSGRNILHAAVIGGNRNCVANILMHGGGKLINMEDIYRQTPLGMARALSKEDIVDMLEAYKMISLRTEGSLKGVNDDDSGYECIITSQGLEETKHSNEQVSEEEDDLSSDEEEEEDETQTISNPPEQDLIVEVDESMSASTSRHFLDESVGKTTSNDVTTRLNGTSKKLLIEQTTDEKNGNKVYEKKTSYNKDLEISFDNKDTNENISGLSEQSHEGKYVVPRQDSVGVNGRGKEDSSKCADTMNIMEEPSLEKVDKENKISNGNAGKNTDNGMLPKTQQEENMSENLTKIGWMINENRGKDVAMATDKCLNNDGIEGISNDCSNSGRHVLGVNMICSSETQQGPAAGHESKQPGDTGNTGHPIMGNQPRGNLLLRRRKKGMPSLIVSRTSSGSSSSFETLNVLGSMGKTFEVDSVSVDSEDGSVKHTEDIQVLAPPIIKGTLTPKPPSNPVPIAQKRQQMRRRKFSTGSPTSGSPKFCSRSDMESYLDEAWRRASDSDVNESFPVHQSRPRSYSTPHPPDPSQISKPITTASEFKSYKNLNAPALNPPSRRQSVGEWGRRNSVCLTFNEWLDTKKEQQRRNSLAVQKERERRLSLGNQSTLRLSKHINYEQWLVMKTMETEIKASQDVTNSCHGNERSREESERAFKTWLQKKDEEALEREQRLLDAARSRRASDVKRADTLSQRFGHHSKE